MLWQAGGDLLTADNTKPAFDSPAGLAALQQLHDMAVTDKSVYLDTGNGNYLNLFNSGKIAMLWTGPWDLSSINSDVAVRRDLPARATTATTRRSPGPTSTCCSTTRRPRTDAALEVRHLADLGAGAPGVRHRHR